MERAHVRTRQLPPLRRSFEHSRLEGQLIATAYELVVPVRRLSASQRSRGDAVGQEQPTLSQGELSA